MVLENGEGKLDEEIIKVKLRVTIEYDSSEEEEGEVVASLTPIKTKKTKKTKHRRKVMDIHTHTWPLVQRESSIYM